MRDRFVCSDACPVGAADCVRGDTGERCYTNYVGSGGCQCRNVAGSIFTPNSTEYSTTTQKPYPYYKEVFFSNVTCQ